MMYVSEAGHVYELTQRNEDPPRKVTITFVNMEPGREHGGTTTQEVIRVLIDRTRYCNNCLPHPNNERIIKHLEMALVLHEARALERKVEKGEIQADRVAVGPDGHYWLMNPSIPTSVNETPELVPYIPFWEAKACYHCTGTENI